jgi:hypothetical protein
MPNLMTGCAARIAALLLAAPLGVVGCQSSHGGTPTVMQAEQQMSGALAEGPHMLLTPLRPTTAADSARAAAIADTLRRAIVRYADVRVAEADGFRPFAPKVKQQRVLHYTRYAWAARAVFGFDPAKPTSLLYRREPDGSLKLIGAMYTAPQRASLEELDRWAEMRDGKPVFGPVSPIATEAACAAVGGRFLRKVFGWMVHANVLERDPAMIWGMSHDGMAHQHQHAS